MQVDTELLNIFKIEIYCRSFLKYTKGVFIVVIFSIYTIIY